MKLAALFLSHLAVATLAVAAYIELSARRGVAAGWDEADEMCPNCVTPWKCNGPHIPAQSSLVSQRDSDDWATDPRTAELATGGGR